MKKLITGTIFLFLLLPYFCFAEAPVVSVLIFENLTGDPGQQWMGRSFSDGLTAALQDDSITLVDRIHLEDIIREQKLSLSGLTDDETALEVGKLLNANHLVGGGYVVSGDTLRVTARITDTSSGEILFSAAAEKDKNSYFALEEELAGKLAGFYGFIPSVDSHRTESIEALDRYYAGLLLLDTGEYEKAAQAFRDSLIKDPGFLRPRESLADSYRFLKDFRKARYQREINALYLRLDNLVTRASSEPFISYGDWVVKAMADGMKGEDISRYTQDHPEITWGSTRVETLWHAQTVMMDIADRALDHFEDSAESGRMYRMMIATSRRVQAEYPEDPFLDEILYMELFAWRMLEEWKEVYSLCEVIMTGWPDARMMWAVEDFYEDSLEQLE